LNKHSRLVFASTLHGYEGSGRGFGLRFAKILHQQTPGWQALHLQQPLRWRNNDKLEHLINQALLLAPETAQASPEPDINIKIFQLDKSALLAELPTLFGLLVQAHYQTRPNDLQQLLDSPNPVWVAYSQQTAVGILLSQEEGNLTADDQDSGQIHGHLLPQLLSRQYGFRAALNWRSWRVMRLAVAPEWQGLGIGTQLVRAWQEAAKSQQIDFLSCSFAAEHRLLAFWCQQGLRPLHLGTHRDKASGSYTLVMIQTLKRKTDCLEQIQQQFYQ
ncbi:MAG: tRNA(Met) cytidine acetyltransferase, partial [Candidatus Moranbacteria bacterium]|nr:tRNA(Met) cytidine acetyltransferase [Candidatus Moranbacteria bacterium]